MKEGKSMSKPAGVIAKTKDNSRKKYQEQDEWTQAKKIGRPAQQWNSATNTWSKIMEPKKVTA